MTTTARVTTLLAVLALVAVGSTDTARAARQYDGLCAIVELEIEQDLTLERTGFQATLTLTNNEGDASLTGFSARLFFRLADGENAGEDVTDRFFLQPPELTSVSGIDGSGIIPPGQTAVIQWFIIPKTGAGGLDAAGIRYEVGAELAGALYGEPIDTDQLRVLSDRITVKPEGSLEIRYFQPRDVDGDDPFTIDRVEPAVPFTLGVLVSNVGAGTARQVRVVSEQPRIVANEDDLLVVPQLLGTRVDDEPVDDSSLTVNIGDVTPGHCRKASWEMITTLAGEFTRFEASYDHALELGGRATSLIAGVGTYFLVHEVIDDRPGRDDRRDFLAELTPDHPLEPDALFGTDCRTDPVSMLRGADAVSVQPLMARVIVTADVEGWVLTRTDDPSEARYDIERVVRSDGKVINPHNAWTHVRYQSPDNTRLAYLNIFDFVELGEYTYTVEYAPPLEEHDPPVTTLRFDGPAETHDGVTYIDPETRLFFTAEDESPTSIWSRLDGGEFGPAHPFNIVGSGQHIVEYYSTDAAGNAEAERSATIVVAGALPVISGIAADVEAFEVTGDAISVRPGAVRIEIQSQTSSASHRTEVDVFRGAHAWPTIGGVAADPSTLPAATLTVAGEHVDFYQYQVGGGPFSEERAVGRPIELAGLAGSTTVAVRGRSRHDGYLTPSTVVTWNVDPAAAPIRVTGAPPMPTNQRRGTLFVEDLTDVGPTLDIYQWRLDNGGLHAEAALAAPIELDGLVVGAHTIDVIARAGADAWPEEEAPTTVHWQVDPMHGLEFSPEALVHHVELPAGEAFVWDGRGDDGAPVSAGWYSVRITVIDGLDRVAGAVRFVEVQSAIAAGVPVSPEGGAPQQQADARGHWLTWQDQRLGGWNIYARDIGADAPVTVAITQSPLNQERPRTDGRLTVWEARQPDGTWDVVGKLLGDANPPFPITDTPDRDDRRPVIAWPWVAYQSRPTAEPDAPWQIYSHNLVTGTSEPVDPSVRDQVDPAIHGDTLVWQDHREAGAGEIYAKNLATGEVTRITDSPAGQYHPAVFGPWIVWDDNRDVQLDLWGYHRDRGVEVRLTNTPENETRPSINGDWVVYEQDAGNRPGSDLRILNLDARAAVDLTRTGGWKSRPVIAQGHVYWTESNDGLDRVLSEPLPNLQAVFDNQNIVAVTEGMAQHMGTAAELLRQWHGDAGISSVTRYVSLLPAPVPQTARWQAGGVVGDDFPLVAGDFLWMELAQRQVLDLADDACDPIDLVVGPNTATYACFPDGLTAYAVIRRIGTDRVSAVRRLDPRDGQWDVAAVVNGQLVGDDFGIPRVSVLMLDMNVEVNAWIP